MNDEPTEKELQRRALDKVARLLMCKGESVDSVLAAANRIWQEHYPGDPKLRVFLTGRKLNAIQRMAGTVRLKRPENSIRSWPGLVW